MGLIPSAVTPQAPSTVRLIGALPLVYLLPGLAVSALQRRLPARRQALLGAALAALLLFNVGRTVRDGFLRWPANVETRLNHYQATLLDIARYLDANPTEGPVIVDAFYEPIDHDSLRRSLGRDLPARWVQGGVNAAGAVVLPAAADGRLFIPEYAPLDTVLLAHAGVAAEPLYRSTTPPTFAVYALPAAPAMPRRDRPVAFNDGALTLLGTLRESTAIAGAPGAHHLLGGRVGPARRPDDFRPFARRNGDDRRPAGWAGRGSGAPAAGRRRHPAPCALAA